MKPVIVVSLCMAIGGCAEYGMDFDVVSAVAPRTAEVKSLDEASTSRLYLSVVNGLLEQGRYRAALAYLDQYAVQEKKTSYFMELYGEALLGTERYDDAAEAFASLEGTEREPQGFSGLGRVSAAKGDWSSAVTHFKQAVAARPSSAEFLNNLGYAQLCAGGGAIADAEFNLRQAQELDPSSVSIRNNLVIALLLSGKENEARRLLSGIPTARERDEVQRFAAEWLKQRPDSGVAKEEM